MGEDFAATRSESSGRQTAELPPAALQFTVKDLLVLVGVVAAALALGRLVPTSPSRFSIAVVGTVVTTLALAPAIGFFVVRLLLRKLDSNQLVQTNDRVLFGVVVATVVACVAAGWPGGVMLFFLITAWPWQILFYVAWRQECLRASNNESDRVNPKT
jgi:hypothetical protein